MATSGNRANRRVAFTMVGIVVGMAALAYASVPLYRLFCQVTGYGGTTQTSAQAPGAVGDRLVTVRFDGTVASRDLPWSFKPTEREVQVHIGENRLTFYKATNNGSEPTVGIATFNVTPHKAGPYFQKVACFCFNEQTLGPGETVDMGVSFYVDPAIENDPHMKDVTITLSYTFFRANDEKARLSEAAAPAANRVN
jgi:cytochrome c oxidase assembly protein subunit 11